MVYDSEFWRNFISDHYDYLERIICKRFRVDFRAKEDECSEEQNQNLEQAKAARSFVSEKLLEDDCRRLRNYNPKRGARPKTYFYKLIQRLISKFFEQENGRYKPTKWLMRQGNALLMLVHKHLCWGRMPETDVLEYLRNSAFGGRNPLFIQEAIQVIRHKYPKCGEKKDSASQSPYEEDDDEHADGKTPEKLVIRKEMQKIILAILIGPDDDSPSSPFIEIREIQEKIHREFTATDEQRLFLRMICQDGMTIIDAGRKLGWTKYKAQGQIKGLRKKLQQIAGRDLERLFA